MLYLLDHNGALIKFIFKMALNPFCDHTLHNFSLGKLPHASSGGRGVDPGGGGAVAPPPPPPMKILGGGGKHYRFAPPPPPIILTT